MKLTQPCCNQTILTQYLNEGLSSSENTRVQDHLNACEACRQSLQTIAGTPDNWSEAKALLSDLDNHETPDTPADEAASSDPSTDGLINYLNRWMGPSDDPTKLGRIHGFQVIGVIGFGGAGIVLKAWDPSLNRLVALKVLLPSLAHDATARKRFERESKAVAGITHPNVVPIHAVDQFNGHPYLAMQYVAGRSLQHRLDSHGPLPVIDAIRIAIQIARALSAAHAQGVIHRDIKPANILLEENVDRVLVTDFGLARVIDEASIHSGAITGTPQYMSPEQCHGQQVDQRSDLFSLGSVIYAMCTGRSPFRSGSVMGMLRQVCEHAPERCRSINPDVPDWLESLVTRLHAKQPVDRFDASEEVADILEAELAHLQNPTAIAKPRRPWIQRPVLTSFFQQPLNRKILMYTTATLIGAALLAAAINAGNPGSSNTDDPIKPTDPVTLKQRHKTNNDADHRNTQAPDPIAAAEHGTPGELVAIYGNYTGGIVDGYSLYLPKSYTDGSARYPMIVYLQGGLGVGGEIEITNQWGIPKLIQQQHTPDALSQYLHDTFIVISPHLTQGQYYNQETAIREVIDEVSSTYQVDPDRIYLTGLSRGGTGTWGLASSMPNTFAAAAPIAGGLAGVEDYKPLSQIPIWVAHNTGDNVFDHNKTAEAVRMLEGLADVEFYRLDTPTPTNAHYLQHQRIMTSVDIHTHDAWTEIYSDPSLYKWLLKQER